MKNERVDKEKIIDYLADGNPAADFWEYLWIDFDGVIVAETPLTYQLPRGYEPEDVRNKIMGEKIHI